MLNEFELLQVVDDLQSRGIKYYHIREGNGCIWVTYGQVDAYYIFQDGKLVDVQYD